MLTTTWIELQLREAYNGGNFNEHASEKQYRVTMVDRQPGKPQFAEKDLTLREFSGGELDLIKELRYQSNKYDKTNPSTDTVHYRFGSFVVSMSLGNFYLKVDGIITSDFSPDELAEIQNKWPDVDSEGYSLSKDYPQMKEKTSSDIIDNVKSWINGKNDEIKTTTKNFEEQAYNAQCGAAMFLSESIRNFHNHITNMMAIEMIDANIQSKEQFFSTDVLPMARGRSWLGNEVGGVNYMEELGKMTSKKAVRINEEIKTRLSRITKTWMAHVEKGPLSGSVDLPPQADASTQNEKNAMKQAFPTREAGAGGFLRVYEQNIPDKLLSTQMSEPEVKSMDAQSAPSFGWESTHFAMTSAKRS